MNYKLLSIFSTEINKKQIKQICNLKNQQWKFGVKSQINWYKNYIKKKDIHNLVYIKSKLVGYTLLRRRTYTILKSKNKKKYLYFDTLIIDKNYRKQKLSNILMKFNNMIIEKSGFFSFLICKKDLVDFYKKNNWIKINKKNVKILDHPFNINGMIFNTKKIYKKYIFSIYK